MLVDTILKHYNLNPEVYQSVNDKWVAAGVYLLGSFYIVLPYLLALAPWAVYLFLRKKYTGKNHAKLLRNIIIASICGILLGLWLPNVIDGIIAGLAVRALYGNPF